MIQPVAITGVGIVSALGETRERVSAACRNGTRPFGPVRRFDAEGFRVNLAAEAPELDIRGRFGRSVERMSSRTDALGLWAAADALAQADVPRQALSSAAVFVGASSGGMAEMEVARQAGRISVATYACYPVWITAYSIQRALGLHGPRATYMTACSSAAHALGVAMRRIRRGELDIAVAGGAEAVCRLTLSGFGSLGVLDPDGTRPFCEDRKGITLGEGAAFFVLERLADAERRGVPILAVLAGYGASSDAHHMVHPRADGGGALAAMRGALWDAGISPEDVDYVNAHGTGTVQNDAAEAQALETLFSGRAGVRVSSSKSVLGHALGAAGALEAAVTVLGMSDGFAPPNASVGAPMQGLGGLKLVGLSDEPPPDVALSSSFAFGGNNASLVIVRGDLVRTDKRAGAARRPELLAGPDVQPKAAVVITGAAVASPLGTAAGPSEIRALLEASQNGAEVVGLDAAEVLGRGAIRRMDTVSKTLTALSELARQAAGLDNLEAAGMAFGTSFGALDGTGAFLTRLFDKGPTRVNPLDFPNLVHNAAAGHASIHLGARGPNVTSCQEEVAGDEALALVVEQIRAGALDVGLCGGIDLRSDWLDEAYAKLDRLLGTRSGHASVAGVVCVESASGCKARGGSPWASVLGVGAAGTHGGAEAAVGRALEQADARAPAQVDVWFQGGTERFTDACEQLAAHLPLLFEARRVRGRGLLGDAAGSGPAVVALAAAEIATQRAGSALVTAVTRDGCAYAVLLGACA